MKLILGATLLLCFVGSCFCTYNGGACGPKEKCTCGNFIMDCRMQNIEEFPTNVPDDIKALYLNSNNISKISQIGEDLELQTLVLTDNDIVELTYDAFDNLDNLKTLQLTGNKISSILNDIFEWNPLKLEVLYLDSNKLEFIQHFLFYDLEELTDLYLQDNEITFVHPHAFLQLKNLRNLRLDGNKLHTFNPKWIQKLQANAFTMIRFDGNPWSCDCAMIPAQRWFKKSNPDKKSLDWFLDLIKDNPLTCNSPENLKDRQVANLSFNQFNATCDLPRITGISKPTDIKEQRDVLLRCVYDKSRFPVPTISWTAPNKDIYRLNTAGNFDGITVHQNGDLLIKNLSPIDNGTYTCNASNSIGYFTASTRIKVLPLPHHAKADTSLVNLTESKHVDTPDKNITMETLKDCPDHCQCISRHIDCSGDGSGSTTKTSVPTNIPTDAITISLASNDLTKLTVNDFRNFPDLEELRLDDNRISDIDFRAFSHLQQLTTLTLQQNKLYDIKRGTFNRLRQLHVLVLDKNRLTKLERGMFEGLDELQWLYVRHNSIRFINDDAFAELKNIKFIHLESNDIGRFSSQMVKTLLTVRQGLWNPKPKIRKIFVDDNNIQCDCGMEDMRSYLPETPENLFGDGIICSNPPKWADVGLANIKEKLQCTVLPAPADLPSSHELPNYSVVGLLFGGIVVGIVLTILIAFLWRRYGRSARTSADRCALTDDLSSETDEAEMYLPSLAKEYQSMSPGQRLKFNASVIQLITEIKNSGPCLACDKRG